MHFRFLLKSEIDGFRYTPMAVDCIFAGILIYQLTMAGVFGLFKIAAGSIIGIILAVLTVVFRFYLFQRYWIPGKYLPLENCPKSYGKSKSHITEEVDAFEYVHPALRPLDPLPNLEGLLDIDEEKREEDLEVGKKPESSINIKK